MKTTKHLLLTMLMGSITLTASAQQNIESAFKSLASNKNVSATVNTSRENDPETGSLTQKTYVCSFSMDAEKSGLIDKVLDAFDKDSKSAYNEFTHEGSDQQRPVSLGDIIVGNDGKMNYRVLAFAEKNADGKPTHRTAYAIEWDKGHDTTTGRLITVYGPIPSNKFKNGLLRSLPFSVFGEDQLNLGNLNHLLDGDSIKMFAADTPIQIEQLPSGTIYLSKKDNEGWLYAFRTLCKSQRNNAKRGNKSSYLIPTILSLCKSGHTSLSEEERSLCIDELRRILEETEEEFDRGLLQEAIRIMSE